jgi:hypothetical protein
VFLQCLGFRGNVLKRNIYRVVQDFIIRDRKETMDETSMDAILADETLTDAAKELVVAAAALDTPESHEALKTDGVITFEALCTMTKAASPSAKDADVAQAVCAVWIF